MTQRKGHVWTASKLDFLERYLPAFQKVCKRYWDEEEGCANTYYVDGFAGPGHNEIDGEVRAGSPLIAAGVVPPFRRSFLVESKARNHEELLRALDAPEFASVRPRLDVQRGDFNQKVRAILPMLQRNLPAFFFLDPEGLELDWETVRLIGQRERADVFVLISAGGVTRCAGSPPTHDRVTRFYGHDQWREVVQGVHADRPIGQTKFEAFIELYLEGLRSIGFSHVERFLIATNSQNANMHALVFAAKNATAIRIAEDILRKIEREQKEKQWGATPLFDP